MSYPHKNLIVIKFGGEIVESVDLLENLIISVKKLVEDKAKVILVHGGGPLASKISQKMGLTPKMVGGRRVTCSETLEVMKMTLPGIINSNVLSILKKHNIKSASASGITFIQGIKRPPKAVSGSEGKLIDWGHVGDVESVDSSLLNTLLDNDFVPVVSPLTSDKNGNMLNINADTISVEIAKSIKATKYVSITAIGGVFEDINDPSSKLNTLTVAEAKEKIKAGVIQGGMIPKIEEGLKLLEDQLDSFHIVATKTANGLQEEINNPGSHGTAILK